MTQNYVLFDVGAHLGQDSLDVISRNSNAICHAFEPTPELAQHIRKQTEIRNIQNRYFIHEVAISDFDGEADFHLVVNDTGSASLNEFADNLYKTWPGRTDFVVRKTIKTLVYRLDTWINTFAPNIEKIDHLHIDAQGSDLSVLIGLGEKISIVHSGVVEVPQQDDLRLYKGQHTKQETLEFLSMNNFKISKIVSNDHLNNEVNIYFHRV